MSNGNRDSNDNDKTDPAIQIQNPDAQSKADQKNFDSFSTNSKIHRERVARQQREPQGGLPRPVTNLLALALIILGAIILSKHFYTEYTESIIYYFEKSLDDLRRKPVR